MTLQDSGRSQVSCPDSRVQLNAGRGYDVTEKEKTFLQYRVESSNNVKT